MRAAGVSAETGFAPEVEVFARCPQPIRNVLLWKHRNEATTLHPQRCRGTAISGLFLRGQLSFLGPVKYHGR